LPFDQVTALGSAAFTRSTVVPLPVPLRPWSTTTQPEAAQSPSASTMIPATSTALLPSTSIFFTSSTGGFAASTPLSTARRIPAFSLSSSSASRSMIACISRVAKSTKGWWRENVPMIAFVVVSSCAINTSRVKAPERSRPDATSAVCTCAQ